ncbi:hypothetical protein V6N13_005032 [Hibiscus sabdariffa]
MSLNVALFLKEPRLVLQHDCLVLEFITLVLVMIAVELGENLGISRDQSGWKERDEADAKAVMGQQLLDSEIGPSDGRTSELGLVTNGGLK